MKKLLVVDDDPDFRTLVSTYFSNHHFEVSLAAGRDEAQQKMQQTNPDVILLDVLLSGSDGRDFCRQLKDDPATQNIPIIIASAHPVAGEKFSGCGAEDFISKPLQVTTLYNRVMQLVEPVQP